MRGTIAAFALLAACSAGDELAPDAAPDAAPPDADTEWTGDFVWTVSVGPGAEVIRIAGTEQRSYEVHLDGEAAARATSIVVEAVVDGRPADRIVLDYRCDDAWQTAYRGVDDWLCSYESGEIRRQISYCIGGFHGDYWCLPKCGGAYGTCPAAHRCGLDRIDGDPTHGWRACVPIGTGALGDVCTIDATGVDDCGAGLYCVDGVCRAACLDAGWCEGAAVCTQLAGMSPGVVACLPPAAKPPP